MKQLLDANERGARAEELFKNGYNCAQAVAVAYSDIVGVSDADASKLVAGYGGGFGRMREMCGAVSGAVFVLGSVYGSYENDDNDAKARLYAIVQEHVKAFQAEFGTYICRELLELEAKTDVPVPEKRTETYYQKRPCGDFVKGSAIILANILNKY